MNAESEKGQISPWASVEGSKGPIATSSPDEMPKRHAGIKPASPLLPASPDPSTPEKTNLGRPSAETLHTGKAEASNALGEKEVRLTPPPKVLDPGPWPALVLRSDKRGYHKRHQELEGFEFQAWLSPGGLAKA